MITMHFGRKREGITCEKMTPRTIREVAGEPTGGKCQGVKGVKAVSVNVMASVHGQGRGGLRECQKVVFFGRGRIPCSHNRMEF